MKTYFSPLHVYKNDILRSYLVKYTNQARVFIALSQKRRTSMTISSKEQEAKKVSITVDRDPVSTSFEKWAQPGHFSRTLAKGPKTTTWIWNLHADAHDFDSHTSSLEDISRKIFSAHFGQLS